MHPWAPLASPRVPGSCPDSAAAPQAVHPFTVAYHRLLPRTAALPSSLIHTGRLDDLLQALIAFEVAMA